MAEAGSDQRNSLCTVTHKRRLEGESVLENETEKSKKMKYETMDDFQLVEILAEDARNKTLILHLQGMWNSGRACVWYIPQLSYLNMYLHINIWHK